MRPGPDESQRTQIRDHEKIRPEIECPQAEALVSLSEEQRRLLAVLQTQPNGMTVRQLQTRLSWPNGRVQSLLESLSERQLVAQLNTIVPSYVYRYGGVDLEAD
jgi:DNA-binding MarR family transcriptional regulator